MVDTRNGQVRVHGIEFRGATASALNAPAGVLQMGAGLGPRRAELVPVGDFLYVASEDANSVTAASFERVDRGALESAGRSAHRTRPTPRTRSLTRGGAHPRRMAVSGIVLDPSGAVRPRALREPQHMMRTSLSSLHRTMLPPVN